MPHTDLSAVAADAGAWFDRYVTTFIGLAADGRTDPAPLLEFFAVPITMTTDAVHLVLSTEEALTAGLTSELQSLRDADYGGSTALDLEVRALNERSVLIEVTWARNDSTGAEFQRVRVLYLAARTVAGWQTTASAILSG